MLAALTGCGSAERATPRTAPFPDQVKSLLPAISQSPTAGICPRPTPGPSVTIYVDDSTPEPRCVQVNAGQHLKVVNRDLSGRPDRRVTITWRRYPPQHLGPGQTAVFPRRFGSYLAIGDHLVGMSRYAGGGAEISFKCRG